MSFFRSIYGLIAVLMIAAFVAFFAFVMVPAVRADQRAALTQIAQDPVLAMKGYHLGVVSFPVTEGVPSEIQLLPDHPQEKPAYTLAGDPYHGKVSNGSKDVGTFEMLWSHGILEVTITFYDTSEPKRYFLLLAKP